MRCPIATTSLILGLSCSVSLAQETPAGRDLSGEFSLPEGLAVTLWAESPALFNPTALDVDARGRVWVSEAVNYRKWDGRNPGRDHPGGDRIVILEDTDGDGACDTSKVFVQDPDLTAPLGIAVIGPRVFVSCSPNLYVYTDVDGDDVPDGREVFLTGFGGFDHDHGLHSVVAGPDGALYFNAGNAGPHIVSDRAGWTLRSGSLYNGGGPSGADNKPGLVSDDGRIWTGGLALRVGADGSGLRVMAHNFRNNYEVALDSLGILYQTDNDDDGNASCRTLWCMPGGNHGYFSSRGERSWSADRRPGQETFAAHWHQDDPGVVPAGSANGAGGPTGICVYEGELLAAWIDGAVLNTDAGASVLYAHRPRVQGAGIVLDKTDLLRPGDGREDQDARWFRPSDVVVGADGSLFVADWYDPGVGGHLARDREAYGRILRIAPAGHVAEPTRTDVSTLEGALAALASPAVHIRELGRQALAERSDAASLERLHELVQGEGPEWLRARALWLLVRHPEADWMVYGSVLRHPRAWMRRTALRALSAASGFRPLPPSSLRDAARDPDAGVRREAALHLGRGPHGPKESAFVPALLLELAERYDGMDRYALEAFGLAAEGQEEALWPELVAALGDAPRNWDARFEGLAWRLHPAAAAAAFRVRALDASLPLEARKRALDALAFMPTREAAEAVLAAAQVGPEDLRDYAAFWIQHRDGNDWRAFGLARGLGRVNLEGAERVWESGLLRGGLVDVDVQLDGAETLWLVVTDGGDGNSCDWADWIGPRFEDAEGKRLARATSWIEASSEWGEVRADANCAGGGLAVGEEQFERGIGVHARSEVALAVPVGAVRFTARAGPDLGGTSQGGGGTTSVGFEVWLARPDAPSPVRLWEEQARDTSLVAEERSAAAEALAKNPRGGLVAIRMAEEGQLDELLRQAIAGAIHTNPDLGVRALASQHFPRAGQAALPSMAEILALTGDPRRGRALFLDEETSQCITCHSVTSGETPLGGDIGPELSLIAEKYAAREILDAILNPSAGISFGYDTWLFETTDGELIAGFLLADGESVVVKDTRGERFVIPRDEIARRTKQTLSTMPDGVATGMDAQELRDLVAFLEQGSATPPEFGQERELFDGESFAGWTQHLSDPGVARDDVWSIEEGVLTCTGRPAGYLRTQETFESFQLVVEWRFDPEKGAGNSGVLLRMVGADKVWPRSIEAQLQHRNAGDIWNIDAFGMQTAAARTNGRHTARAQPCSELPLGEWNRYEILVDGPRLELRVNGVLQNTADWCEELPGFICLQSEGAEIQFRRVSLRPILGR